MIFRYSDFPLPSPSRDYKAWCHIAALLSSQFQQFSLQLWELQCSWMLQYECRWMAWVSEDGPYSMGGQVLWSDGHWGPSVTKKSTACLLGSALALLPGGSLGEKAEEQFVTYSTGFPICLRKTGKEVVAIVVSSSQLQSAKIAIMWLPRHCDGCNFEDCSLSSRIYHHCESEWSLNKWLLNEDYLYPSVYYIDILTGSSSYIPASNMIWARIPSLSFNTLIFSLIKYLGIGISMLSCWRETYIFYKLCWLCI